MIILDNSELQKLNIRWVKQLNGVLRTPIEVSGDNALVLHSYERYTKEYNMFKIDSENGTIVWENTLPAGGYASPCVGENIVFMPCGYTQLSGLSKSTGELLWNYDFGSRVRATPKFLSGKEKMALLGTGNKFFGIDESGVIVYKVNLDNGMLFEEPIVIEDSIYSLGVFNPTKFESKLCLFEFSLSEEKLLNQIDLGAGGIISCDTSGLTSHGDNLVIGTHAGKIKYYDHHKKDIVWEVQGEGILSRSKPWVKDNKAYLTSSKGYICGVDLQKKKVLFNNKISNEGIWSPPITYNKKLVVHGGLYLYLLDMYTGDIVDKLAIGQSPYTGFSIVNGRLFIAAGDPPDYSNLLCFTLSNNTRLNAEMIKTVYKSNQEQHEGEFDEVAITFKLKTADGIMPEEIYVDLSIFGLSSYTKPNKIGDKLYTMKFNISPSYKLGNYGIIISAKVGNKKVFSSLDLLLKDSNQKDSHIIKDFNISKQEKVHLSGGTVLSNIMYYFGGSSYNPEDINTMGEKIEEYGVHPHHKWRSGSARIFHSSSSTLDKYNVERLKDLSEFK